LNDTWQTRTVSGNETAFIRHSGARRTRDQGDSTGRSTAPAAAEHL